MNSLSRKDASFLKTLSGKASKELFHFVLVSSIKRLSQLLYRSQAY